MLGLGPPVLRGYKGCVAGDATHLATDGPAPRRYGGDTPRTVRCVPVFVRSEKSNALVGDGVLQPAPRSANLDSAFALRWHAALCA